MEALGVDPGVQPLMNEKACTVARLGAIGVA